MRFELESHNRNVPEEDLLNELRRIANLLDSSKITIDQFNEHAKFHSSTLSRRFGSWFKALDAAGLERTRNLNLTNEQLFENLVTVWLKLGRQPKYDDMKREHSLFSAGTYDNRFGTWRKGLEAFVSWANEGISPDLIISGNQPTELRRGTRNINWRLRAIVLMRDGARCQMCGAEARNGAQLHVDHILPWSKGGTTTLENLRILCNVCNIGKSNIEVDEAI
jgi:hypothetical protein